MLSLGAVSPPLLRYHVALPVDLAVLPLTVNVLSKTSSLVRILLSVGMTFHSSDKSELKDSGSTCTS